MVCYDCFLTVAISVIFNFLADAALECRFCCDALPNLLMICSASLASVFSSGNYLL